MENLYTIVTNKAVKGRRGSLVAMIKGTRSDQLIDILRKIPRRLRIEVKEVTVDMEDSLNRVVDKCFPGATKVIDRLSRLA